MSALRIRGLPGRILPGFLLLCLSLRLSGQIANPWEVRIYRQPLWVGEWISLRIEPGMRQKRVDRLTAGWGGRVASMAVGANVAAAIYAHTDWESDTWSCADQVVSGDAGRVSQIVWSLIVFPKASGFPVGVCLSDARSVLTGPIGHVTFFPLPEREAMNEEYYAALGHVNLDRNANEVRGSHEQVGVTLYEEVGVRGAFLQLPGAAGWASMDPGWNVHRQPLKPIGAGGGVNFGQFNWSDRARSLVVRWLGPPLGHGPQGADQGLFQIHEGMDVHDRNIRSFYVKGGYAECESACEREAECKAFTWVKPGLQGADAVCWLKSDAPWIEPNPGCISGTRKGLPVGVRVTAPPSGRGPGK